MMKRNGIISLCLAALMLLSVCSGCASKAAENDSDATESSINSSVSEEASTDTAKKSIPEHTKTSSQDSEAEAAAEPTPEPTPAPAPEHTSYLTAFYNASADALENLLYNYVLPDSTALDSSLYTDDTDMESTTFAIFDADCDGKPELYVTYTATIYSCWMAGVYSYDEDSGRFICELYHHPAQITFYDNGSVEVYDYRGSMRADFSPYSIYKYNSGYNIFEDVGHVHAWQREMIEVTDFQFPYDIDKDGDGYVYYIDTDEDTYYNTDEDTGTPVDGDEYEAWRNSFFGNAHIIEFDEQYLTQENINALRR
jgi:hypothetical protein